MKLNYVLFCSIVLLCLAAVKLSDLGQTKALAARGLLEVEAQQLPVAPYHPDVQFTVAAQPTALTCGISWAILTGSDSSNVSALVSSDVRQGDCMTLFQFVDLDAQKRAHAYVLIAEPAPKVGNQTPFNHTLD